MPQKEETAKKRPPPGSSFARARAQLTKPAARPDARVWTRAMAIIAACGILAAAILMLTADERTLRAVLASRLPILQYMTAITNVGKSDRYLIPAAILFLVTAFLDWSAYRKGAKIWLLRLYSQSAFLFGLIGRARPKLIDSGGAIHFEPFTVNYDFASMPSGHSATMGAVTLAVMLWFPKLRWLILPAGFILASTRIAARAHYPSDVVAGFTIGLLFALCAARWLGKRSVVFRLQTDRTLPETR
jgi:membrane-associated phospholipid phosphatase